MPADYEAFIAQMGAVFAGMQAAHKTYADEVGPVIYEAVTEAVRQAACAFLGKPLRYTKIMSLSPEVALEATPAAVSSLIIGIDLGTTNSLVAVVEKGVPVVLPDPKTGETLVPSVVYFPYSDVAPVVGIAARPYLTSEPTRTIYSAKRLMGKGLHDAYATGESLSYRLSSEYKDAVRIDLGAGHVVSAPEVGALVLRTLKDRAEAHLGQPVAKAVVTVPAYFNDAERQATKDAGTIAGLEIVRIVNEPTAASLAYGLQNTQTATIAVYDLGGGTFDISILRLEDGVFEVLATGGDTHLGGDDFDNRLTDWLLMELNPLGADIERHEARVAAEAAKQQLSTSTTAEILGVVITRDKFEELTAPLINRTLAACHQTMKDAGLTPAEIDQVVLVGGSTRVPAVRRAVGELFRKTPHTTLNPDEVVALGAAIQADILSGNRSDLLLLDITPLSLGLETMGGATEKLLFRNTKIPATAREEFTTSVDGQTTVLLHIVQGEREMATDNRSLARLQLAGIPPMPAGIPKIEVVFLLDANGILQVSAKEVRSGAKTDVRIQPSYGLGETEVKRMVRESFRHADEDFKNRMLADMRNEADAALNGAAKLLAAHGENLAPDVRTAIERDLAALKAARDNAPDHAQVREAMDTFENTARPLAEIAMSGIAKELVGGKSLDQAKEYLDERIKEERPDEDDKE